MTKTVRIENADANTSVKVRVRTQYQNKEGEWVDAGEDDQKVPLDFPTAMASLTIYDSKRLIVEEYKDV